MKVFIKIIGIVSLFIITSSCSRERYVAVEESEFGIWQNRIEEICNDLEYLETYDDVAIVKEKAEKLKRRMYRNFIDPDDADTDRYIRR